LSEQSAESARVLNQKGSRAGRLMSIYRFSFFLASARNLAVYNEAWLRAAAVALAVERFRQRQGRWPADLNELLPALLPRVPNDPFDGNPIRYRQLSDGVVIYSIGSDGLDNGGVSEGTTSRGPDIGVR